jgi:plasmid stabilization system protein ParE
MGRSVRLTAEALNNLAAISDYIRADSAANAKKWLKRIEAKMVAIANAPLKCEIAYPESLVGQDVRQTFLGVYVILHVLEDEELVVITVRHAARRPLSAGEVRQLR